MYGLWPHHHAHKNAMNIQVKQISKGKICSLSPPKLLENCEFEHLLDVETVPKLITLSPLFPCLNN